MKCSTVVSPSLEKSHICVLVGDDSAGTSGCVCSQPCVPACVDARVQETGQDTQSKPADTQVDILGFCLCSAPLSEVSVALFPPNADENTLNASRFGTSTLLVGKWLFIVFGINVLLSLQETEAGEWGGSVCSEADERGRPGVRHSDGKAIDEIHGRKKHDFLHRLKNTDYSFLVICSG